MNPPQLEFTFSRKWQVEILPQRPLILPPRHFVYPSEVEEVERGALEIMVRPEGPGAQPFLATCALGFRDPMVPTGVWSTPNEHEMCAVSGGYAYVIDTNAPAQFTMLPYRPVLQIIPLSTDELLLFVGNRTILAWGAGGQHWESAKLSDEGITITTVDRGTLQGVGWNMITDKEICFTVDLQSGLQIKR